MSKSITRCPLCETAFRVSDEHLNTPKGQVRCGSCLNVFVAREHIVKQTNEIPASKPAVKPRSHTASKRKTPTKPQQASLLNDLENATAAQAHKLAAQSPAHKQPTKEKKPQNPTKTSKPATQAIKKPSHDDNRYASNYEHPDDLLISDDMDTKNLSDTGKIKIDSALFNTGGSKAPSSSLFERRTEKRKEEETITSDDSWALDLLRDDAADEDISQRLKRPSQTSDNSKKTAPFKTSATDHFQALIADDDSPAETSRTKHNFRDNDDEDLAAAALAADYLDTSEPEQTFDIDDTEDDYDERFFASDDDGYNDDPYDDIDDKPNNKHYLNAIEPEPVEFSWIRHGTGLWYSRKLWFALSLFATITAVFQIGYYKFDYFSVLEPYRPYYAQACNLIGCQLPAQVDLAKIRAANLVVRSHPHKSGVLLVDAVLQNSANFEQRFPALDLIFTDMNNRPVAAKKFLPREYLSGELSGKRDMPINNPIHIALQVEDPGEAAVNYQMNISQVKN